MGSSKINRATAIDQQRRIHSIARSDRNPTETI